MEWNKDIKHIKELIEEIDICRRILLDKDRSEEDKYRLIEERKRTHRKLGETNL